MTKKTLEVTLLGESYKLVTDDSDEHVLHAARLVDTLIHDIEYSGVKDQKKATILAALQLASKLIKLEQNYSTMHGDLDHMHSWIEHQVVKLSEIF